MNLENSKKSAPKISETVGLLQNLISIQTVDPPGNEMEAARFVGGILEKEGIGFKIFDLGRGRGNLVARLKGEGSRPSLVYSAHFDTISVNEAQWTVPPFEGRIQGDRVYGRGATDMKSGMASMIAAAVALKRQNVGLQGDLVLAFTAAENSSGLGAKHMVDSGELDDAGAMVISEPSSLDVFVAEKGALWIKAVARGASGHGAFVEDWRKDYGNAIIRMSEFISRLKQLNLDVSPHKHLGKPSINVGKINGGVSAAIIPGSCTVEIDIRMLPGMTPKAVTEKMKELAGEYIDIEVMDFKPPVETSDDDPFVSLCISSCRSVLCKEPLITGVPYYSDATIFIPAMKIPMVIIGPGESGHSGIADEYVEIEKLIKADRIFFDIAKQYLSGPLNL